MTHTTTLHAVRDTRLVLPETGVCHGVATEHNTDRPSPFATVDELVTVPSAPAAYCG